MSVDNVLELPTTTATRSVPRVSLKWIVDAPVDLTCFIGGAAGGYGLFFLHAGLGWPMETIWLAWYVLLDIPHFFGTYARTYLDREERRRRPLLLWGSLAWLLVGPMTLAAAYGLYRFGSTSVARNHALPYELLVGLFVPLWAYWHVVRQHYGILSLYKRKNGDAAKVDHLVDRLLLYIGLLAPFFAFMVLHPTVRRRLRSFDVPGMKGNSPATGGWDDWFVQICIGAIVVVTILYFFRQLQKARRGEPINLAKLLFLLAVVPLHVFVSFHPVSLATTILGYAAFVTIFHDLQYHAIVWHTQRNRFGNSADAIRTHGAAAVIGRHFFLYAACALALGLGSWALSCLTGVQTDCLGLGAVLGREPLFGAFTTEHLLYGVAVGFIMHHYFVDQFIWRPSKDSALRRELRIAAAAR